MDLESGWWIALAGLTALVVFFALGWFARGYDVRSLIRETKALPANYFRGVNHLLNNQPDQAIASLQAATEEHAHTAELQFALGTLFRQRGEIDRALKVHRELTERSDISANERATAQLELARDYHKAGLLDYAERELVALNKKGANIEARKLMLDLSVQEKDWPKSIESALSLGTISNQDFSREIAQYHCERAIELHKLGDRQAAIAELDAALAVNNRCVRAILQKGEWLQQQGQHESALAAWRELESLSPDYFGLAARGMYASYKALGRAPEGLARLRDLQSRYPSIDFVTVVIEATREQEGAEAAYHLIAEEVARNPTLVGLDMLLTAQLADAPDERRAELELMKKLVASHAEALAVYHCASCGFRARQFYWRCPACTHWESFAPKRTAELETAERHLARIQLEG